MTNTPNTRSVPFRVAADSAATVLDAFIADHLPQGSVTIESVVVEQTDASDADFNVEVDGSDLFSSEESVSSADTPETKTPDQNIHAASDQVGVAIDVSDASGTGTSELVGAVRYSVT